MGDWEEEIGIDFEVHKAITALRETKETTPNDVLRRLLGLPPVDGGGEAEGSSPPLIRNDIEFPSGTELLAIYKGKRYTARVIAGRIIVKGVRGKSTESFSRAAKWITETNVNGWTFWKVKRPGDEDFVLLKSLQGKSAGE